MGAKHSRWRPRRLPLKKKRRCDFPGSYETDNFFFSFLNENHLYVWLGKRSDYVSVCE